MKQQLQVGQIVTGINKTGKYVGEITMAKESSYVIRVLAVLKHPTQGDLHHPKMVDVGFFHERRASAFGEQVNIPAVYVKSYESEVPHYEQSLKKALEDQMNEHMTDDSLFAQKSLEILASLEKDYFK